MNKKSTMLVTIKIIKLIQTPTYTLTVGTILPLGVVEDLLQYTIENDGKVLFPDYFEINQYNTNDTIILDLIKEFGNGAKLKIVKGFKNATGMGLKEAKETVDLYFLKNNL